MKQAAKQRKLLKGVIKNRKRDNIPNYKTSNTNEDHLSQKEEEGKQYEQQNYQQMNKDIIKFMSVVEDMQKSMCKMENSIKKMKNRIEETDYNLEIMEKTLENQFDEIDQLHQKVSKQKAKLKKACSQSKKSNKIIQLRISNPYDDLNTIDFDDTKNNYIPAKFN